MAMLDNPSEECRLPDPFSSVARTRIDIAQLIERTLGRCYGDQQQNKENDENDLELHTVYLSKSLRRRFSRRFISPLSVS